MPVITAAIARYRTHEMPSAPRMPSGTSRFGFRDSSAVVEAVSNPMYEKKMIAAPCMMPLQPKWPRSPVFGGIYGCQFDVSTYLMPTSTNTMMTPTFRYTMNEFAMDDFFTPT